MILDQIRLEDINQELKMGNQTQENNKKKLTEDQLS